MDTRRYGKGVTVVRGLESKPDEAEKLARDLKKGLATGGSGKGGVIVLQGAHRKDGVRLPQSKGYNVRGRRPLSRTASIRRRRAGGTLKAVVVPRFGGPEVLELDRHHPDPVPGPDQVVVRVHAASLNHLDLAVREGIPTLKLTLPHILGCDAAGDIAEVGSDVTDVEVGDRVVVNPGVSCGRREHCLRGEDSECVEYQILAEHLPRTYAGKVSVPAGKVVKIPTDNGVPPAAA